MNDDIPLGWSVRPLSDVVQRVARRVSERPDNVMMIAARQGFVRQSDKYSRFMAGKSVENYVQLRKGEFAYNRGNSKAYPFGCVYRLRDQESAAVPFVYLCFAVDEGIVVASYLEQLFLAGALNGQLRGMINSGVRNNGLLNIRAHDFYSCNVLLPPRQEQERIAKLLSLVDEDVRLSEKIVAQLSLVREAVMYKLMEGTQVQTDRNRADPRWPEVRLGDVCTRMFVGVAQAATHAYVEKAGVPLVRTTNLRPGRLRVDDILYLDAKFAAQVRSKSLETGDVLIARTGYTMGTAAVVPPSLHGAQCFSLLVCRPTDSLDGRFLCHLMNSPLGRQIVSRGGVGGAQQNLNVGTLQEVHIRLPSIEEQERVVATIDAVCAHEQVEQERLGALRSMKVALSARLFDGSLRMPDGRQSA